MHFVPHKLEMDERALNDIQRVGATSSPTAEKFWYGQGNNERVSNSKFILGLYEKCLCYFLIFSNFTDFIE